MTAVIVAAETDKPRSVTTAAVAVAAATVARRAITWSGSSMDQPRLQTVVQGGRRFSFTALVIVGDGKRPGRCRLRQGEGSSGRDRQRASRKHRVRTSSAFRWIGGTIVHPVQGEAAAGVDVASRQPG